MTKIEFKIEKVKEVLDILATHDQIIFRGGTALSLAYDEIKRSSEDIDFSVLKGEHKLSALISIVKKEVNELSWTDEVSIEEIWGGESITITFNNEGVADGFNGGSFTYNTIYLELPKQDRKDGEVPFVIMKPYLGSLKTMKVMSIEAILKDKGMAITERFLKSGNLEWAIAARADARHIYDFFVLYDKHISKVTDEIITKEIENSILKKDHSDYRSKYSLLEKPLDIDAEWELFDSSYKTSSDEINKKINAIVYPNAIKYNKTAFLKKYKEFFYRVLKLINTSLK